ncbi:MAG: hypothetical protein JO353_08835 [Phycisphaerae bacterium]|nr:hypothetical protein [Phycisphaerae bacterium]
MLHDWLHSLPDRTSNGWLLVAIGGLVVGIVLWINGARFSRLIIGLTAVTLGGLLGLALPKWMNWSISGAAPAVALALVFGVSGYIMQRLWVATFLGLVLAAWAFLVTWVSCRAPEQMKFNTDSLAALWKSLPLNVANSLPYTCGAAALCGFILAIVWPRLGIAAAWSTAGVSLITALGSATMKIEQPNWITMFPQHLGPQLLMVIALILAGIGMQWRLAGRIAGGGARVVPAGEAKE